MSWLLIPTELKLNVLQHLLASPLPIDHSAHIENLVYGGIETLISTSNTSLVKLSLEAYYRANTFVIKSTTTYRGFEETKTFRPREKHALQMQHIIDETVPMSPPAGVPLPVDSGYASRTESETGSGGAAPNVTDLACALEKAVGEEDPAKKKGNPQRKLFDYVNSKDWYLRSQRKSTLWKEGPTDAERTTWRTNRSLRP